MRWLDEKEAIDKRMQEIVRSFDENFNYLSFEIMKAAQIKIVYQGPNGRNYMFVPINFLWDKNVNISIWYQNTMHQAELDKAVSRQNRIILYAQEKIERIRNYNAEKLISEQEEIIRNAESERDFLCKKMKF
jgi:hypothetical protein